HLPEQLARLVRGARDAETTRRTDQLAGAEIDASEGDLVLEHRVGAADGADRAAVVLEGDVALGRAVHLADPWHTEPLLNRPPGVGRRAGPGRRPEAMVAIARRRRLTQEIAAELADVQERDHAMATDVVQEGAGAESPARGEGRPGAKGRREADEEA